MTFKELRGLLVQGMGGGVSHPVAVNQEILDRVFPPRLVRETRGRAVMAYQAEETMVFVSHSGLNKPRQILFIDLANGTSFLQEIEN